MDDAQAQQTNPLFGIIPKEFFTPLASPNRLVYWDCLCRLFQARVHSFPLGSREKSLWMNYSFILNRIRQRNLRKMT